jgi:hypothetical protein
MHKIVRKTLQVQKNKICLFLLFLMQKLPTFVPFIDLLVGILATIKIELKMP